MISKLDKLFGSKTRVTLLSKLMLNPDKEFHIRELSKVLSIPYGMLHREVKNLISLGILKEKRKGRMVFVSVNRELSYFDELKGLIIKTTGIANPVKDVISKMKDIRYALIFGSFARGEESGESDVDLLIIGDVDEESILKGLGDVEKMIGREINFILWNNEEFLKRVKSKHHLLMDIIKNPVIMLLGDEDEFRGITEGKAHKKNKTEQ